MSKKEKEIKEKKHQCNCGDNCTCNEEECNCHNEDKETIELLSKRIKELEDTVLRTQAELQNYRKRKDEETARILKYAEEDILKGFLPILDNFERAAQLRDIILELKSDL